MESMSHVIVATGQGLDGQRFNQIGPLISNSVRSAYDCSGHLDLVLLIGGNTAHDNSDVHGDQVIEYIQEECINFGASDLPTILVVPGTNDIHSISAKHMLVDTLTRRWRDIAAELWSGDQEDVIEALEDKVFSDYIKWQRSLLRDVREWHSGTLPGEGSLDWTVDGQRIGVVIVNTVFRSLVSDGLTDRATLVMDQMENTAPGDWQAWTEANALTVIAGGLATALPAALDPNQPMIFVSGKNVIVESAMRRPGWVVVDPARPACLRIQLNDSGEPDVQDIARSGRKNKIAIRPVTAGSATLTKTATTLPGQAGDVLAEFYEQVSSGRMLAVLVSGLSDSQTTDIDTLWTHLMADVFGEAPEPAPHLSEVWAAATKTIEPERLMQRLGELGGEPETACRSLHRMLTAPWWRVYDFSAAGTLRSVVTGGNSGALSLTNALKRKPTDREMACEIVAMNGVFDGTVESVDFSIPPPDGMSARALWFNRLKSELVYHPVVFFAESASSDALWQLLESANQSPGQDRYPRFLVTPAGGSAALSRIEYNNLKQISTSPASFASERLMPGNQYLEQGKRRIAELISTAQSRTGISLVSTMIDKKSAGSKKFLEGHEPEWGDIIDGFAAKLSMKEEVLEAANKLSKESRRIVLLQGRAGSGKTTTLMQCAYYFHRKGKVVGWLDRSATKSLSKIRTEADELDLDVIFVDDVDIFGNRTDALLRDLSAGGRALVVAAVRNTKLDFVPSLFGATSVSADDPLSNDDLKSLIDLLKRQGLLGKLKQYRYPPGRRLQELRRICDRSLLVAMIEVVTGKLFDQKVRGDFDSLNQEQSFVYSAICVLESGEVFKGRGVNPVDLLQIVSQGAPSMRMENAIEELKKMRLVTQNGNQTLQCWHRTIADAIIRVLASDNPTLLGGAMKALLRYYARYSGDITDSDHPYRRTMIRLLNHALMIEFRLKDDVVRDIYDSVNEFLDDDFHYWLQRGEFELQRNHLERAANYFQSARGCGGVGDYKVDTGWASVTLRLSASHPGNVEKGNAAFEALNTLDHVCRLRGNSSEHSFVVMVRGGTEWLEKVYSVLPKSDFDASWDIVNAIIALGRKINLSSVQFERAVKEYEPRLIRLRERQLGVPT